VLCELHLVPPSYSEAKLSESKLMPCDVNEHLHSASVNSIEHDLFPNGGFLVHEKII